MADQAAAEAAAFDASVDTGAGARADEVAKCERRLAIAEEALERISAKVEAQRAELDAKIVSATAERDRWAGLLAAAREG